MIRRGWANAAVARRLVQAAALLGFFALVLLARRPEEGARAGAFLQTYFLLDPLVLALTWLAAHAVPGLLLISLVTVVVTAVLGRVFCGWFCPLGTLNALAGRVLEFCWPRRPQPEHWSPWQLAKYYVLAAVLLMAACGAHFGAVLDPLVLLYRTTVTALLPGAQWAIEDGAAALGRSESAADFLRQYVTEVPRQTFLGSGTILAVFVAILALNRYRRRFWCRYVCPLGALLGVVALRPLLRRSVAAEACNGCDLCGAGCHGAASTAPGSGWIAAECMGCFNCTAECRGKSLAFRLEWPWQSDAAPAVRPSVRGSRRSFLRGALGAAAGGAAGALLLRATPQARGAFGHRDLVRPPGALAEREFLQRCTACGLCMRICPTGCLQPAWGEAGLEGLWTPRVEPRLGHCEYDCTLCGEACPTGAIAPLTVEEKHAVKIGLAVIDRSRCIPFAYGRDCGTCVEACPFPEKALYQVDVEVQVRQGKEIRTKVVGQPVVDPDRCTGCGACVKECPFKDEPAIRVVGANESRAPGTKQFLDFSATPAPPSADVPGADNPYGG